MTLRDDLLKSIDAGLQAEHAEMFMLNVLRSRRVQIYEEMESSKIICYQNIDNSPLIMLHFELKVLRRMENEVSEAITEGREAHKRLQDLDRPNEQRTTSLRF